MKYIRTKDGRILVADDNSPMAKLTTNKVADDIRDLIMIGDLVVWYSTNSKRDEYFYIHNEDELFVAKHFNVKQFFIKVDNDFRLVAEMKDKGDLKLL